MIFTHLQLIWQWLTMDDPSEYKDLEADINPFDQDDNSEDDELSLSHSSKRQKILDFLRAKLDKDIKGSHY